MGSSIAENEHSSLIQKLEEASKNRQLEEFFNKVLEMCRNHDNFRIPTLVLPYFHNYCASLGSMSAHKLAVDLVEIVRNERSVIGALTLLRHLICSVQILNASKLREYVQTELVELHNELFTASRNSSTSFSCAIVSYCIFHTISMEISYKDDVDREKLRRIWKITNKNEKSEENPILLLCSFLLARLLGEDSSSFAAKVVDQANSMRLKKADIGYIQEFVTLVEQHFASIVIHFPNEPFEDLMEFLVLHYLENNKIEALANIIYRYPELRNNQKTRLVASIQAVLQKKKLHITGWDTILTRNTEIQRPKNTYSTKMTLDIPILTQIIQQDPTGKLLDEVLFKAKDDKVNEFLATIKAGEVKKSELETLFQVLTTLVKRERPTLLKAVEELFMLVAREDVKDACRFEFAAAFITMLKGNHIFHDFVLLTTTMLSTTKITEFEATSSGKRLSKVIQEYTQRAKIIESIFISPEEASSMFTLIGLELAEYISKVSELKRAKIFLDSEKSLQDAESLRLLKRELHNFEHVVNTICYKIGRNEKMFVRYLPFVISNCLTGDREPSQAMHRLLSMCDHHGIALLSTNLPAVEKRKFAVTFPQFQKAKKFEL